MVGHVAKNGKPLVGLQCKHQWDINETSNSYEAQTEADWSWDSWSFCSFSRPSLFKAFSSPCSKDLKTPVCTEDANGWSFVKMCNVFNMFVKLKKLYYISKANMWQAAWLIRTPFQFHLFRSSSGGISSIMILGSSSRVMVSKTCAGKLGNLWSCSIPIYIYTCI